MIQSEGSSYSLLLAIYKLPSEDVNAVFHIERGVLHQIQWLTIGIGSEGRLCDDDDATYGRR